MLAGLAEVAAPIRKLWMLYFLLSMISADSRSSNASLKRCRVRPLPSWSINSGPERLPLNAKYGRMLLMGHKSLLVLPRYMLTPLQKGSVFDCLIFTCNIRGLFRLSIVISLRHRWHVWLNWSSDGTVNSLKHRNPKKVRQHAAHVMTVM